MVILDKKQWPQGDQHHAKTWTTIMLSDEMYGISWHVFDKNAAMDVYADEMGQWNTVCIYCISVLSVL